MKHLQALLQFRNKFYDKIIKKKTATSISITRTLTFGHEYCEIITVKQMSFFTLNFSWSFMLKLSL